MNNIQKAFKAKAQLGLRMADGGYLDPSLTAEPSSKNAALGALAQTAGAAIAQNNSLIGAMGNQRRNDAQQASLRAAAPAPTAAPASSPLPAPGLPTAAPVAAAPVAAAPITRVGNSFSDGAPQALPSIGTMKPTDNNANAASALISRTPDMGSTANNPRVAMANGGPAPERGLRSGGEVCGPGTGTSDSIPAMLSKGEYVMPADTVRAIGKENLDEIKDATHTPVNNGLRNGYADGGIQRGKVDAAFMRGMPSLAEPALISGANAAFARPPAVAPIAAPQARSPVTAPVAPQASAPVAAPVQPSIRGPQVSQLGKVDAAFARGVPSAAGIAAPVLINNANAGFAQSGNPAAQQPISFPQRAAVSAPQEPAATAPAAPAPQPTTPLTIRSPEGPGFFDATKANIQSSSEGMRNASGIGQSIGASVTGAAKIAGGLLIDANRAFITNPLDALLGGARDVVDGAISPGAKKNESAPPVSAGGNESAAETQRLASQSQTGPSNAGVATSPVSAANPTAIELRNAEAGVSVEQQRAATDASPMSLRGNVDAAPSVTPEVISPDGTPSPGVVSTDGANANMRQSLRGMDSGKAYQVNSVGADKIYATKDANGRLSLTGTGTPQTADQVANDRAFAAQRIEDMNRTGELQKEVNGLRTAELDRSALTFGKGNGRSIYSSGIKEMNARTAQEANQITLRGQDITAGTARAAARSTMQQNLRQMEWDGRKFGIEQEGKALDRGVKLREVESTEESNNLEARSKGQADLSKRIASNTPDIDGKPDTATIARKTEAVSNYMSSREKQLIAHLKLNPGDKTAKSELRNVQERGASGIGDKAFHAISISSEIDQIAKEGGSGPYNPFGGSAVNSDEPITSLRSNKDGFLGFGETYSTNRPGEQITKRDLLYGGKAFGSLRDAPNTRFTHLIKEDK